MGDQDPFSREDFLYRTGTFLVMVGILVFFFFLLSESANQADITYFCWSVLLFTVGFMMRSRYRRAVKSSGRLAIFNRTKSKPKEEKKKPKPEEEKKK